jgi:uncharacterized membrane protein
MSEKAVTPTASSAASNDKVMAMVATLPLVGLIMFFAMTDSSALVKNYAKQSNFVLALWVLGTVIAFIPFGFVLSFLLSMVELAAWVVLLINASSEKMYKLPVVGEFFDTLIK